MTRKYNSYIIFFDTLKISISLFLKLFPEIPVLHNYLLLYK